MEWNVPFGVFYYISLAVHNKLCLLIKQNLAFVVKSPLMEPPLWSHNGAAIDIVAYFKILLYISFRFPSKGALPVGSARRIPVGSAIRFQTTILVVFQSRPSTFRIEAPIERDACYMGFALLNIHDPQRQGPLPPIPMKETRLLQRPSSSVSQNSGQMSHHPGSSTRPYRQGCPFSERCFTRISKTQIKSPIVMKIWHYYQKSPVNEHPLHGSHSGPYRER